jgi:cell shape-determining protein MreC
VAPTITDGMTISVKEELSLIVINLGSKQGVKIGMPFRVLRGENVIGNVQVVDVREKIAAAIIQNLSSEREPMKVGDRLVVDARP